MLKIFCVVCLLGLSATTALVGDATQTSAQSPTDHNLVNLVQEGRQLSKANVKRLEFALKSIPYDLPTRARLLGFYFHSSLQIFGRTTTLKARRRHILWLIENHPDSSVAGLPEASIEPRGQELADEEGYRQARELWLKQVERNKNNEKVRLNAATFGQRPEIAVAEPVPKKVQAPNQLEQATSSQADFQAGLAAYNRGDYETAFQLLQPLAEQGDATAQYKLGVMHNFGQGVRLNYHEAMRWYRKAAEQGHHDAQHMVGAMYANGEGVWRDYAEAAKWFRLAADQGLARAQYELAEMYRTGRGVPQNYAEAAKWYQKAAEQGHSSAQSILGTMYEDGKGVSRDFTEAAKWYRKAAEQADAGAQHNLGLLYSKGLGVQKDPAEGFRWLRKAAENGDVGAQVNLGITYENGEGVAQNYAEAAKWYRKAAERDHAAAQNFLGAMYASGRGVAQDYIQTAEWYRRAANQGHVRAQNSLGIMYALGQGVPQDLVQSYKWISLAVSGWPPGQGRDQIVGNRDMTAEKMTREQIAEAQHLANQWLETHGTAK
jgi:TPR repeat protein